MWEIVSSLFWWFSLDIVGNLMGGKIQNTCVIKYLRFIIHEKTFRWRVYTEIPKCLKCLLFLISNDKKKICPTRLAFYQVKTCPWPGKWPAYKQNLFAGMLSINFLKVIGKRHQIKLLQSCWQKLYSHYASKPWPLGC